MKDLNKEGIGLDNWIKIGEKLRIDIFTYVPHLKKFRDENPYPEDVNLAEQVAEMQERYQLHEKNMEFFQERVEDYQEIVNAKNALIENLQDMLKDKNDRIKELEKQLSKGKRS